ncbi:RagB/SusD family nutrient uptake outer membrane protein [Flagellimonas marinaquae]|uniref:RagB/SusD family nutrient uptake outer membrane protein n=1 Tax=Flagellimonas aurea TaxID=2915619 RepID=A0ABS3G011_9FLAO|nr:RagB/SusD family nutrient uptake outer membrane protein [Allomuricauda aurea]MAO17494.1 RagB/SusD family nutrient uptake outer membrane protein [Allomuricauda sp.]MBO0352728.1 RagB/SusD family nutrient uptake outer membrane protein [Allomuricauda aurea]UBZ15736.1 RagB/SusD family nutrient uptake outer membrane protein [Allomuricauda aquimarina]
MNRLKTYIFLTVAIVLTGCDPELESINYDEINPSIFPSSEADVESLVIAAYHPLRGAWSDGIHTTSENGLMFVLDATTEILQGNYAVQQEATLHRYNPTTTGVTRFYDTFYNKISAMTLSIDRIANSDVNENIKEQGIAEIRCARGLLAYELFDMYGPLVIAPLEILQNPLEEAPLARLSHEEMVSFIETDLLAAIEGLPTPEEATYGRFSQGLARMILIRLYLHEKRWGDVLTQANAILDMGYYELEDDYVGLWDVEAPVDSREVIWAIPADYAGTSENQWQLMVLPSNFPERGGWGTIQSSWKFYDSFEEGDIRKTNLIAEYTGTDGVTYNRENPANYMQLGPLPLKIAADADRSTGLTTVDIIQYRFADVLLSKAEALANMNGGGTQEAIDLVNIVRERAQIPPLELTGHTDIDSFNTMILVERSHEYWCENGQYRSDLIRHGKYVEYANDLNGVSSESAPYKVLFPFSLERISEGKGAFLQNPGYN